METVAFMAGASHVNDMKTNNIHSDNVNGAMNASVFENLFDTHYKRVYNFIAYRINNHQDAEELASTVFEKVIEKYHTYRPARAPVEAWIISIAKNVVNDYFRRIKKRTLLPLDFLEGIPSDKGRPEDIVVLNEENAALLRALTALSDRERTVVAMKFAAGLKNTEIADIMSLSEANVGIIVHRSMKKMRRRLEGEPL